MLNLKNLFFFILIFGAFFCQKSFANEIYNDKVYSILSVKFILDDAVANRIDSKFRCKLFFRDDYKEKVNLIEDHESNYITIISNPGKIFLENITCSTHNIPFLIGKSRKKIVENWGFVAHKDFLNYAGEITINFDPSSFQILDIFNLANLFEDSGKIRIDVNDNSSQILNFINYKFVHLSNFKLIKSIFTENRKLQPNEFNKEDIIENSNKFSYKPNPNENNYKSSFLENNIKIKENEIRSANPTPFLKKENTEKKPIHPYLSPIYSDFYNPIYNPYNLVKLSPNPYISPSTEIQDPAVDRYYFDDEIKNLDLK